MKKYIWIILFLFMYIGNTYSQEVRLEVSGVITDANKQPLVGVNITIKNMPTLGTTSDINGKYKIKVPEYNHLVFTYMGYTTQEHLIKDKGITLDIVLEEKKDNVLDEVTVTATGVQKKVSLTASITTVDVEELKVPTSSVSNALAGVVPGIIARQTSGQPGSNFSEFWIRGISTFGASSSAMVLVDGFERNMDELSVEDIKDFTVLKDAAATAIYGSRGANGVVLITTKQGHDGKTTVDAKAEFTYTTRTSTPEFVDGVVYASLMNEALTTRNKRAAYSLEEIHLLQSGLDPDIYPNVDWMDILLKNGAPTFNANIGIRGGGTKARYYLSGAYRNEGGMYNVDKMMKDYSTNANYERYNYRLNLDLDVTPTTKINVGIGGSLEKTNHAGANSSILWHSLMGNNPIALPVKYSNGYIPSIRQQGNDDYYEGWYTPWVVATQTGYAEIWKNTINTNISLDQDLGFITEGLRFTGRFGYDTYNYNYIQRRKNPEMWRVERLRDSNGDLVFYRTNQERLMQQFSSANGDRKEFFEANLNYKRTFGDHTIGGVARYTQEQKVNTSSYGGDIMAGINRRYQSLAGNASYNYKDRYLLDFNFGYTGSENFAKGHQFGFFPAGAVAWNLGEENFIKDNLEWVEMFKIRYSYGKAGTDNTTSRFPYLANIGNYEYETYGGNRQWLSYNWGDLGSRFAYNGMTFSKISSNNVTWEIAKKQDLGIDMYLFGNKFNFTLDYFHEKRTGIYWSRWYLPETTGVQNSVPSANIGAIKNEGFDGHLKFASRIDQVNFEIRGNFTYSKNEITEADELYTHYGYRKQAGYRYNQAKGLVSLGLFKDYEDIRNSPRQDYGEVMPGDIKYKDINGDGVINDNDIVPIGATTVPNLIYGFGLSANWNGFDFNLLFQGAGKSNFFINGFTVYPFQSGEWGNILTDFVESNRWILEENEDVNAEYPRLSYGGNGNNYRASTYWLRNGAYLRLKTLEVGYTVPKAITNRVFLNKVRIHFIGQNLLTFSPFKLWDPEMGSSNGQQYPLGRTFTVGLNISI